MADAPGGPGAAAPHAFQVGRWRVEVSRNLICDDDAGEERRLEPQLASLLSYFAARPGAVIGKDELLEGVWGTRHVADSALTRAIAELRRSLGDEAHNPSYIETIPKRGYRLLAEVRAADSADARSPWMRRLLAAALVGAMLLGGILAADWLRNAPPQEARASSRRIAVLPLVDLSAAEGQEYFADAMTDALTTVLARVPSLSVTSRRSVERYRGSDASSLEIADGLGVDLLLEGTVLRDAKQVRLTVQLVEPRTEEHVWAGSYERELRDVVAVQGEIAVAIASEVQGTLTAETRRDLQGRSVDPRAHDLYLQGRHLLRTGGRDDREKTRQLFEEALEADPTYAPAWAGLAEYHTMLADHAGEGRDERYLKAEEAALEAVALDPQLAEAHASLGMVAFLYRWDWDRAHRHFLRALELNPSDAAVRRQYAFFLTCQGRFEEAIAHSREAVLLDPLTEDQRTGLGWILLNAGRYDESLRALEDQPARMPKSGGHRIYVAWNHALAGRYDEAIALLESHRDDPRGWLLREASLGWTLARAGRHQEAREILSELAEVVPRKGGDPYLVAVVAAGLEDLPSTMEWLERAFEERSPNMIHVKIEPFFGPIRNAEPYREMVRRMNL